MADPIKPNLNHLISPIREEDTRNSDISHGSSFSTATKGGKGGTFKSQKSHTYSNADGIGAASTHSYSEIYESRTRESIDETQDNFKNRVLPKKSLLHHKSIGTRDTAKSVTWTHKYTTEQIDKSKNKIGWDEMINLEQLYSLQMINTIEYRERKRKLIDSMTGTKVNIETENKMSKLIEESKKPPQKRVLGETEIIKKIVNFKKVDRERAIRHSCRIKFIYREPPKSNKSKKHNKKQNKKQQKQSKDNKHENDDKPKIVVETKEEWEQDMRIIKMAKNPFNNGTLRYVYYMQDITDTIDIDISKTASTASSTASNTHTHHHQEQELPIKNTATHVAKISIDPMEEIETYFHDVAMQKHAQRFADEFNKNEVPKKVGFLDCWVYELVDRTPHIFCGVEKCIFGDYHKYTNNWDWVNQTVDRNTPSAFSHFTYEASKHKILICDLQGVGDLYTDPQMHTFDGKGCGKGNMGKRGIEKFLSSHKCNAICTYLKLPSTNLSSQFTGTLPQKRYMNNDTIDQVPVTNGQYTVPDTSQTNGQFYGATTTKSTLLPHTQYNNGNVYHEYNDDDEDDDDVGGGYPFGKRLPDHDHSNHRNKSDHQDSKCWCNIL